MTTPKIRTKEGDGQDGSLDSQVNHRMFHQHIGAKFPGSPRWWHPREGSPQKLVEGSVPSQKLAEGGLPSQKVGCLRRRWFAFAEGGLPSQKVGCLRRRWVALYFITTVCLRRRRVAFAEGGLPSQKVGCLRRRWVAFAEGGLPSQNFAEAGAPSMQLSRGCHQRGDPENFASRWAWHTNQGWFCLWNL